MPVKNKPLKESTVQILWMRWVKINYPGLTIFHIPNGGYRHYAEAAQLKRMGVLPGVYDLYCMDYKLFIEFKKVGGRVSAAQKSFEEKIKATNHDSLVFFGYVDGVNKFKEYSNSL